MKRGRMGSFVLVLGVCWAGVLYWGNDLLAAMEVEAPSRSLGTHGAGTLIHGRRLPSSGPNFRTYSRLGSLVGRSCVEGGVKAALLAAFAELEKTTPGRNWVYGETGRCVGGNFWPHRTHQAGRSVDILSPMIDDSGEQSSVPDSVIDGFGYAVELDGQGRLGERRLDAVAVARLIEASVTAGESRGRPLERVILALEFQGMVKKELRGRSRRVAFNESQTWVRHDDHVHLDFGLSSGK
jgi:penicillin-insensitive murein endopeptidase